MRSLAWGLAIVVAVAASARADVGSVSPGRLARPHARFENQCDRCHANGGLPASLCLACHTRLADRLARDVGFHATVTSRPCSECHREHRGRDAALAPEPPATFDHRASVFALDGRHAQLACARCHSGRWVGISSTCARCHRDTAHRGQLGADCAKCHRADGWKSPARTAADHRVSLAGGHAGLACADCHRSGRHLVAQQTCSSCHTQRHGGTRAPCESCHAVAAWKQVTYAHRARPRLEGKHATATCLTCHPRFTFAKTPPTCEGCHARQRPHGPLGACERCHSELSWHTRTLDHAAPEIGFALDGAHAATDCTKCHSSPRQFGGPKRTCTSCHPDVHRSQFAPKTCTDCHTTVAWRPSTITTAQHTAFRFPLRDSHARTACARCHRTGTFVGTATSCTSCHADVRHRGRFGTRCETCHDEASWANTPAFDHETTGFALERGHAGVACARCHGNSGRALIGRAAPQDCRGCHATPHDRFFGSQCTKCHSTASWRAVPRFDHDRTAFPLERRHATLRCTACHSQRRPAIQPACRSCHGDPHRVSNSLDCEDCHRPDRWRIIRFDHDRTGYPLTGRHRIASCGRCHTNPNWTGIRTDCVACHGFDRPRDDTHLTDLACEDCHTTASWRTIRR